VPHRPKVWGSGLAKRRLSEEELQRIDATYVASLPVADKDELILMLVAELRDTRDRLGQNSRNSSRPPSSEPPWQGCAVEAGAAAGASESASEPVTDAAVPSAPASQRQARAEGAATGASRGQPGRRPGAAGAGRAVSLPVTGEVFHHPTHCERCGSALAASAAVAWTAMYVLDLDWQRTGAVGLAVTHVKHVYTDITCACGQHNRAQPGRCPAEPGWQVALSEWHLVGPLAVSFIVCLTQRLRCSRRLTQEFLRDWFGVSLSTSTINQCIHEAGRALAPVEDQLVAEVNQAALVHGDETSWKEWGVPLWLWVFCTSTVTLYLVGYRTKEIIANILGADFSGWLMSDGYQVYRDYVRRLRCWAHLLRKAKGLSESLDRAHAQPFGQAALSLLEELMQAVYTARAGPAQDLRGAYRERLEQFRALCECYRDCTHEKTRALAREFLNDWDAIWKVLEYPWLPLTNNEAEQALRHWVIARRISQGTRTEEGTRAFALLASVIETCRKRSLLPWPYIAEVLAQRRQGLPAPPLPGAASL